MAALSRMSREQLLEQLLKTGYTKEDIETLKRPDMIELLNHQEQDSVGEQALAALEEAEETEGESTTQVKIDNKKDEITPQDSGWTQYIIGQFEDDELDGKNPRVEGLRRIAEKVIGEIIEEGCDLVAPPNQDNEMRACVKAWIIFNTDSGLKRYEALADAYSGNCLSDYGAYITAMADTRAKGRCLRNALKLRRIVSAEEIDPTMVATNEGNHNDPIDTSQITGITIVAKRINVSIPKLLQDMSITGDISALKKGDAKSVLQKLNCMSLTKEVPERLKGE